MTSTALRAWVDESGSDHEKDPGTYVLAAAIGRRTCEDDVREQMARLRLPGQVKLHWRDETERRRATISRTVAGLDVAHLAVVRSGVSHERPERRRRKCLERLLHELQTRAVDDVILESRGPHDNGRDVQMLNALRGQAAVGPSLRLSHVIGRTEPMLWIPDTVCGAVTSARTGVSTYLAQLESRLTLIEIAWK